MENFNSYNIDTIIKPDIIIDYLHYENPKLPVYVIYVRPQTNLVSFENAILKGVQSYADIIYLANINGKIFINNALILDHYSCEYKFSIFAKQEIAKYPEMINKFEEYFKVKFDDAKIVGSFDAMLLLGYDPQSLFELYVEKWDFLKFYGQTIKKIDEFYIVNYDMPAIIQNYDAKTNIFVTAISLKDENITFKELNESIISEIKNSKNIDPCEKILCDSYERAKRTFHLSRNHIKAMFDMSDFIFRNDGKQILLDETPLGKILIEKNILSLKDLVRLKSYPIVYVNQGKHKKLINIVEEGKNKNIDETIEFFKSIKNFIIVE
jgi:hypothetical protein